MKTLQFVLLRNILLLLPLGGFSQVQPYPDNSLEVVQYESFGLPSPDTVWAAAEYRRVWKVVKGFYEVDKLSLPRQNSEASGVIFSRMIDTTNFQWLKDTSIAPLQRLKDLQSTTNTVNNLLLLYYNEDRQEQRLGKEFLEMATLNIFLFLKAKDLLLEFSQSPSGKGFESKIALAIEEIEKMVYQSGLDYLTLLEKNFQQFDLADLQQFTKRLEAIFAIFPRYCKKGDWLAIQNKTNDLAKNHPNPTLRKAAARLYEKIK